MCSDTIKDKMRNTCVERYGGIGMASDCLAEKTICKTLELYGKTPTKMA